MDVEDLVRGQQYIATENIPGKNQFFERKTLFNGVVVHFVREDDSCSDTHKFLFANTAHRTWRLCAEGVKQLAKYC